MANVCQTCGDEGFVGALVHCDSCKLSAVHRYCCGITPVPIDGYVTWFCSDCDESDTASDSVHVELQDTSNDVEVSSSPPVEEPETTREIPGCSKSNESTGLLGMQTSEAGDGASLLQMSKNKKKKKKRKIITHSLPDAPVDETMEVSKKQDGSENGESDELVGLARDEVSVLEKTRKKKKKKKKTDKGEEKKSEESSNHSLPVLEAGGHELQASTSVEPMKESKKRKISDSKESELNGLVGTEVSVLEKSAKKKEKKKRNGESSTRTLPVTDAEDHVLQDVTSVEATKESTMPLNVLAGNEASVLEKNAKKKKKKKKKSNEENSNHTSPVLKAVDCGLQDTTSVEAMKESMKHKTSDELIGEKREKRKKTNAESSNHTPPVLPAKDNVEPAKAQESSASRKHHELAGLEKIEASVSEGGNSTNMPDHNSCTTSKKTSISSRKIQVTNEIMESPANNTSCKDAESNMPALDNDRAQPIYTPVWRGSVTVKEGNICSIDGLVAHLSTLACHKVHEKACSLCTRLSAEMFPRLDIWPPSFLSNGSPNDDDIALYFFPSSPDSNGEKVYYSLVDEMKKKDLAMRCLLDDVELLIFTSYQLPLHCWKFHSKEYLWGSFRRRKTFRH